MEEDLSITPYIMRTNVKSLRTMVIRANILVYLENSVDSFESLQENVLKVLGYGSIIELFLRDERICEKSCSQATALTGLAQQLCMKYTCF